MSDAQDYTIVFINDKPHIFAPDTKVVPLTLQYSHRNGETEPPVGVEKMSNRNIKQRLERLERIIRDKPVPIPVGAMIGGLRVVSADYDKPIFGIRPKKVDEYGGPESHQPVIGDIAEFVNDAIEKHVIGLMGRAELSIRWETVSLMIDNISASWDLSDLFDEVMRELDKSPQEIEDTANELLPVLKKAVEELEKRVAQRNV